jgi:8-oxo-dGTP pyrophosphatase MutT (NUDIX family)
VTSRRSYDRQPSHAGVVAFRRSAGGPEILLVEASGQPGTWVLPKGHIERGESIADAAAREALEEAGISGHLGADLGTEAFHLAGRRLRVAWRLLEVNDERPAAEPRRKRWLGVQDAIEALTFDDQRRVATKAAKLIAEGERP